MKKIPWHIKLLVFVLFTALLPLIISGIKISDIAENELKSNLNTELINNVNIVSEKVDNYFEDRIRNLLIISDGIEDPDLTENERYSFFYNGIGNIPDVLNSRLYIENEYGKWIQAVELNRETFASRLDDISLSSSDVVFYNDSLFSQAAKGIYYTGSEYLDIAGTWVSTVVVPFTTTGGYDGVIACKIDLANLRNTIDEAVLNLRSDIYIITPDSMHLFLNDSPDKFSRTEQDVLSLLESGRRVNGVVNYEKDNINIVGSYTFTRYPEWGILTETNAEYAYLPVKSITDSILLWIGVGILIAVTGSLYFTRMIGRPVKKISDASRQVASGDFNVSVDYHANDSIGELAHSIESTAAQLKQNFDQIEAQNKQLEEYSHSLEEKVKERTEKLHNTNKELKEAYLRLVELNRDKDEFLGIAAHDLKNPLAAIRGYSELLMGDNEPEEIEEFAGVINDSSNRMLEIINNLLLVNKIEQGSIIPENEHFNAVETLNEVIGQNRISAVKKDIIIEALIPEKLDVEYDRYLLSVISGHIISNAVKFSPFSTKVLVEAGEKEGKLFLSVTDEGPGIPEDEQGRVFEKFPRLSVLPTDGENCTGLGLSIVKSLTELSGGEIEFTSKKGEGSTFIVFLPVAVNG